VAVAEGYPGPCRGGDPVFIDRRRLERTGARLFAAGARPAEKGESAGRDGPDGMEHAGLYTAGGRVLALAALGADAEEARSRAYAALDAVSFRGMGFRRDIGDLGQAEDPPRESPAGEGPAEAGRHGR
jgi:phosphoribosylamine--glycine ligase